jgi:hypothetical protein
MEGKVEKEICYDLTKGIDRMSIEVLIERSLKPGVPTQLRIDKDGTAYFADQDELKNPSLDHLLCRFEIFTPDEGTSQDMAFIDQIVEDLTENYPNPKASFIDN